MFIESTIGVQYISEFESTAISDSSLTRLRGYVQRINKSLKGSRRVRKNRPDSMMIGWYAETINGAVSFEEELRTKIYNEKPEFEKEISIYYHLLNKIKHKKESIKYKLRGQDMSQSRANAMLLALNNILLKCYHKIDIR